MIRIGLLLLLSESAVMATPVAAAADVMLQMEEASLLKYPLRLTRAQADVELVLNLRHDGQVERARFLSWTPLEGAQRDALNSDEAQAEVVSAFSSWKFSGGPELKAVKVSLHYRIRDRKDIWCVDPRYCTAGFDIDVTGADSITVTVYSALVQASGEAAKGI